MEGLDRAAGSPSTASTPRFGPPQGSTPKVFTYDSETRLSGIIIDGVDEAALPSPRLGSAAPSHLLADPEDFVAPVRDSSVLVGCG